MPIATILALIQALVALVPEAETVLPIIEKMVQGQAVTEADIATLDATTTALNATLAARVAAAEAPST